MENFIFTDNLIGEKNKKKVCVSGARRLGGL